MSFVTAIPSVKADAALPAFGFVIFANEKARYPKRIDTTSGWRGLRELLSAHAVRPSKSGPAFSPIAMRPEAERGNHSVLALYALVIDSDSGLPPKEALKRLDGYEYFIYSTHSDTPEQPRYRIVLPLQTPVLAADWKLFYAAAVARFGVDLIDTQCSDVARLYYLPSCPVEEKFRCWDAYRPGQLLDPVPLIASEQARQQAARTVSISPLSANDTLNDDLTAHLERPPLADIESALTYLDPDEDYDLWLRIGWGIAHGTGQSDEGKALFDRFSAGDLCGNPAAKYKGGTDIDRVWDSYDPLRRPRVTVGTLFHMASQRGWRPVNRTTPLTPAELLAYPPGDSTNAKLFAGRVCDHLLFNCSQGVWMAYDGVIWRKAEHGEEMAAAKKFAYDVMASVADLLRLAGEQPRAREWFRAAQQLLNRPRLEAMLELAKSEPGMTAVQSEFDADPYLLATPVGVVDLRSGELRTALPGLRLSRMTGAGFDRRVQCPRFLQFLDEITGGDRALQESMQRMCGYWLTGDVSEEKMVFAFGVGANGKSVFVNTLFTLLGDYAANAPMDTFMETRGDRHPTDLAGLRGSRFVGATETEQGRRWNESKIKEITGGDRVSARFMRQDFFTYLPQFKLVIAGNHKPAIRNIDEAMRRRLHLIPFTITVPPEKRDKQLQTKLLAEANGIFSWGVEGCLAWQREGLRQPQSVLDATDEYFEAEDALGRWLEERCVRHPNAKALTAELFTDWKQWAEAAGEFVGSQKRFADLLLTRGLEKWRNGMGLRGFQGVGLKETPKDRFTPYADN